MGYVERHLLPRERLLYTTRLHWGLFAKPVLAMLGGVMLTWALYSRALDPPWLWQVGVVLAPPRPAHRPDDPADGLGGH